MLDRNRSGQPVFFTLVSALSGNAVTGQATGISGRVTLDGGSMAVVAGVIDEPGGGQYRLLPFAADTNGNVVGLYFTASGCVPVSFTIFTQQNVSGRLSPTSGLVYPNSGAFVNVPPATVSGVFASVPIATISGVIANSGIFASVPIATISGVIANSGLTVTVPPATISGVNVTADVARWLGVAPNALLSSGRVDAAFNVRTNVARSGTTTTIQLDAGAPTGTSGIYDGDLITIVGGSGLGETRRVAFYDSSGNVTVDRAWSVAAFNNSIFTITPDANPQSGVTRVASGANAIVPAASVSGVFVTVPIATISGVIANSGIFASVPIATLSGVIANSGIFASVPIATLSGVIANSGIFVTVPIATISGAIANSGLTVTVLPATLSGVVANSGLTVTVVPGTISGTTVSVLPATLSGVVANSGLFVTVLPANLSGVVANSGLNTNANIVRSLSVAVTNSDFTLASGGSTDITLPATYTNGDTLPDDDRYLYCELLTVGGTGPGQNVLLTTAGAAARQYNVLAGTMPVATDHTTTCVVVGTWQAQHLSGTLVLPSGGNVSLFSGLRTLPYSGQLSGQVVSVPPATLSGVVANSGLFVTTTATVDPATISGATVSVVPATISGVFATVPVATLSGVVANSGLFVTVPKATISGVIANSGLNVTATATLASGDVYLASGQAVSLNSGQSVLVYSGQLSGQQVNLLSGNQVGVWSGVSVNTFSGATQPSSGSLSVNTFASGVLTAYIPDKVLQRDFTASSGVIASGTSGRCLVNAARKLTNKWDFATSGYLTIFQEDDNSIAYQQVVVSTSGAQPVTSLDTR